MSFEPRVAILPKFEAAYAEAVKTGGGAVTELNSEANSIVWTDSQAPGELLDILKKNPQVAWVQLPFAGVDNFGDVFSEVTKSGYSCEFTSAKGAYREPVAEHALTLALALARVLPERIRAKSWGAKFADTLFDANVVIVGGGGIAAEIARLLSPFRARITVVRRESAPIDGVATVPELERLDEVLPTADFVFLAAALTSATQGLFNHERFALMKPTAYLINIARGPLVDSRALEMALIGGVIAGAGIDVTDPEPLPVGHPLWDVPNLIITPHTADTPEMCIRLLSERIVQNIRCLKAGNSLVGQVNLNLGY